MPDVAGDGALLVDPTSVDSIRAGICHIIEDGLARKSYTDLGYQNVKRFSKAKVVEDYIRIYKELSA